MMDEPNLWAMFACAALAGNASKPSEAASKADGMIAMFRTRFPEYGARFDDEKARRAEWATRDAEER